MTPSIRRPPMRRAVVLFPNGLTLGNLFFGVWAIVSAARGQFEWAGWCVVLGGICDAFDGRAARVAGVGGRFGEELDSLVDVVTFGLAPSMIMYFAVLHREGWDWIFSFLFVAFVVLRLARFNVSQAGTKKSYFQGLPSPAAGITLATYYWFSQSRLYTETFVETWPWQRVLRLVMLALSFLMWSNVPYPVVPNLSWRSFQGWIGIGFLVGGVSMLVFGKLEYFFPLAVLYISYGLVRYGILRLAGHEPRGKSAIEDIIEASEIDEYVEYERDIDYDDVEYASRGTSTRERKQERERERGPRVDRAERAERGDGDRADRADRAARRERRERRERTKRAPGSRETRPLAPPAVSPAVVRATTTTDEPSSPELAETSDTVGGDAGGLDGGLGAAAAKRRRRRRRPRGDRPDGGSSSSTPDSE